MPNRGRAPRRYHLKCNVAVDADFLDEVRVCGSCVELGSMDPAKALEMTLIKDSTKLEIRQSKSPHLPKLALRSLFLANSSGGKTTLIVSILLNKRAYRDVFSAIYVFSPSVHHDGTWGAVKKYVRDELHKKEEEHFFDDWNGKKVQEVVDLSLIHI